MKKTLKILITILLIITILFCANTNVFANPLAIAAGTALIILSAMACCGIIFDDLQQQNNMVNQIYTGLSEATQTAIDGLAAVGNGTIEIGSVIYNEILGAIEFYMPDKPVSIGIKQLENFVPLFDSTQPYLTTTPTYMAQYQIKTASLSNEINVHSAYADYHCYVINNASKYQYCMDIKLYDGTTINYHSYNLITNVPSSYALYVIPFNFTSGGNKYKLLYACLGNASVGHTPNAMYGPSNNDGFATTTITKSGVTGQLNVISVTGGYKFGVGSSYFDKIYPLNSYAIFMYDLFFDSSQLYYGTVSTKYNTDYVTGEIVPINVRTEDETIPVTLPASDDTLLTKDYVETADIINPSVVISVEQLPANVDGMSVPQILFTQKFPFCLPWDLYNSFANLVAPAEPPVFVIDTAINNINGLTGITEEKDNIIVDFTQYEALAVISRWGMSLLFVIGLILLSRKIIGAS